MVLHQFNNKWKEAKDLKIFKFQYGFTSIQYRCNLYTSISYLNSNMVLHQLSDKTVFDITNLNLNSNMVLHQLLIDDLLKHVHLHLNSNMVLHQSLVPL